MAGEGTNLKELVAAGGDQCPSLVCVEGDGWEGDDCTCSLLSLCCVSAPGIQIHPSFQHVSSFPVAKGSTAPRMLPDLPHHCHRFLSQLFEDYAPNSQRPGTQLRRDLPAVRGRQREGGRAHHGRGMQAARCRAELSPAARPRFCLVSTFHKAATA